MSQMRQLTMRAAPLCPPPGRRRRAAGFTLLEVLVAMTVFAVAMGVAASALTRWRDLVAADNFVQGFAFDVMRYRGLTHATGTVYRVRLTDARSYVVENLSVNPVTTVLTRTNPRVTVDLSAATQFTFSSRGYARAQTSGGVDTSSTTVRMTQDRTGKVRDVLVTALGLAQVLP